MLHAATNDGAPQVGMRRHVVADNDQPQLAIARMLLELRLDHGECLHQAREILLRLYVADIEQKRIIHLVALEGEEAVLLGVGDGELLVDGVVNHLDAVARNAHQADEIALGGLRDRDDAIGAPQAVPQNAEDDLGFQPRSKGLLKYDLVEVMQRHHVGAGYEIRNGAMRDVKNIGRQRPQQELQTQMIVEAGIRLLKFNEAEILGQLAEKGMVARAAHQ